ncbi:hypothetical protein [Nostoc sp.]
MSVPPSQTIIGIGKMRETSASLDERYSPPTLPDAEENLAIAQPTQS